MDIVIGDGLIGRHIHYLLRDDSLLTTRKEIDLSLDKWDIPKGIKRAFICAGETSTEYCESHREESQLVNVTNTVKLAERLMPSQVIWISSERVFDGSQSFRKVTDATCPTTEYGRQKAITEELLLRMGATVIRFSKVLGWDMPLFEGWVKELEEGKPIYPFSNMSMSPLPVGFAVNFIKKVSELREGGLYQVSALEDLSYEQIARHITSFLNRDACLVKPVEAETGHFNSTLDDNGICKKIGMNIPFAWKTIYEWCEYRIECCSGRA